MDENSIKNAVQTYYADIATSGRSCCSDIGNCCSTSDLIQVGEKGIISEADLGLSCGSPTAYAGIKPGDTVLDLGSGAGVDVFRAAAQAGPTGHVIGVDLTPAMIARANGNAASGGYSNVEFRLGDIEALPVEDNSIDVVISNCVINLAPDKNQVFKEIYRVLRPGGRFSISDMVTMGEVPNKIRRDLTMWAGCIAGAIDREEYLSIIRHCSFERIEIRKQIEYKQNSTDLYGMASITLEAVKPI